MNSWLIFLVFIFSTLFSPQVYSNGLYDKSSYSIELVTADCNKEIKRVSYGCYSVLFNVYNMLLSKGPSEMKQCITVHQRSAQLAISSTPTVHIPDNKVEEVSATKTPVLVNPSSEKKHFQLILILTADGEKVSLYVKNSLSILSTYQKKHSFKVILFTRSPSYEQYAKTRNVETIREYQQNKFNLPILRSMFDAVCQRYSYDYLGYLNSDILIHPGIFKVLQTTTNAVEKKVFPPNLVLASRVARVKLHRLMGNICANSRHCLKAFKNLQKKSSMRTPTSADVFIFTQSFPLDALPPLVVGRRYIDYILTTLPFNITDGALIDITNAHTNIHQGLDTYRNHLKTKFEGEDDIYNRQFVIRPVRTCVDSHFKICKNNVIAKSC